MNYPNERHEFTVSELAHACGVSRKTLLRMEECGFLKPYRVNTDTGYRYYDAYNASSVGQYQLMQLLGLTRSQITDYYYDNIDRKEFLKTQKEKFSIMQRTLEELELRSDPTRNFSSSIIDVREICCYCDTTKISDYRDSEKFFYSTVEKCMIEGYTLLGLESLFGLSEYNFRKMTATPHNVTACVPIVSPDKKDSHIVVFPKAKAFSMIAYGEYSVIEKLCISFWEEFDKREFKAVGEARFEGIVAPYTGEHITSEQFCYRLLVPIE